jgi:hypothetical protein
MRPLLIAFYSWISVMMSFAAMRLASFPFELSRVQRCSTIASAAIDIQIY